MPDDLARRGIINGRPVPVHPAIPAYLETLFPHANGRPLGGGAAEYLFSPTQPTDEHFFQLRLDHRLSVNDRLFARFTYDLGDVERIPADKPPISNIDENTRNTYITLEHQHTFSPSVLNMFRVGLNRSVSLADNARTIDIPASMSWLPGEPFGYLTIRGMVTEMAGDFRLPRDDRLNNWQVGNTLILTRGRHSARFGVQAQYLQFDQNTTSQKGGIVNFPNLESFLAGRATSVDFAVPGLIDPERRYRQWLFAAFVQDDVRLGPRLTANLGLRYEFVTVPTEADGKISNLRNVTDTALTVGGPWHDNPSLKNFAPRIGLAWDATGDGKTSVRGGFGLFYDEILPKYYFFSGSLNPPFTTRTSIANPPFPNVVANFDPNAYIRAQLQTVNYDLQTPYMMQFNVGVQRALAGRLGRDGGIRRLAGEEPPAPGRREPGAGDDRERGKGLPAPARAAQPLLHRDLAAGDRCRVLLQLVPAGRAEALLPRLAGPGLLHVLALRGRRERHQLPGLQQRGSVRDGLVRPHARPRALGLPCQAQPDLQLDLGPALRPREAGLAGALFKGWQLNNITTIRSGHPFTVQLGFNRSGNLNTTSFSMHERPDLKPGCSNNPILGGPDRYLDVNCFQLPPVNQRGDLGRNTLIGPGLVSVDVSLVKSFELGGGRQLQFRAECFNLPNHPNFAIPSGRTAFTGVNPDGTPIVAPTAGRITSTVTTSRQIQLGLKLTF